MTKHLVKRQAPRRVETSWPGDSFSGAWESGPARRLRRRYLGVHGWGWRPRQKPGREQSPGRGGGGMGQTTPGGGGGVGKAGGGGGGVGSARGVLGGGGAWVNR